MELFSVQVWDRSNYYCRIPACWAQSEAVVLLFVPTSSILSHYSGRAMRGSTDNDNDVGTISPTKYVFVAGAMFVINATDGTFPRYYTLSNRFGALSGGVMFRLSGKSLGACKYFGQYSFTFGMSTDSVRTALPIHKCSEID